MKKFEIALIIVFVFAAYLLLKKLGLIPDKAKRTQEAANVTFDSNASPLSENWLEAMRAKKKFKRLDFKPNFGYKTAEALAKDIYTAKGTFTDNESAVFAVFEKLKTKADVFYLQRVFRKTYNESLQDYLQNSFLNESETARLQKAINEKPDGNLKGTK